MAGRVTPVAAAALINAFRHPRGGWRVQRRITGTPLAADFEGTASWTAAPASLANAVAAGTTCSSSTECTPSSASEALAMYTELGILTSPALPHPMEAARSYGYGYGGAGSPHVLRLFFDDGRPFVDLDLAADVNPKVLGQDLTTVYAPVDDHPTQRESSCRVIVAQGEHLCSKDLYKATFAFVIDDCAGDSDAGADGAPSWTLCRCTMIFDVRGPAKDYRSVSHLTPLA